MDIDGSSILVTGGCGLVGSTTIDMLLARHAPKRIVILDNLVRGTLANVEDALTDPRVQLIRGDIRDVAMVRKAMAGIDAVIHMAIFLAPLSLLGALAIVRLRHSVTKGIILAVYAAGAIVLCGLEQETIRAFTANSRATLAFAARNPDSAIYVVTNAERLNMWVSMVSGADQEFAPNLRPMAGLFEPGGDSRGESHERLVVVDRQTLDWGRNALRSADDVPACWIRLGPLPAVPDRSAGHFMVQSLMQIAQRLPGAIAAAVSLRFERQMTPLPADVYRVPDGCS